MIMEFSNRCMDGRLIVLNSLSAEKGPRCEISPDKRLSLEKERSENSRCDSETMAFRIECVEKIMCHLKIVMPQKAHENPFTDMRLSMTISRWSSIMIFSFHSLLGIAFEMF
jgi:hypothetical protein